MSDNIEDGESEDECEFDAKLNDEGQLIANRDIKGGETFTVSWEDLEQWEPDWEPEPEDDEMIFGGYSRDDIISGYDEDDPDDPDDSEMKFGGYDRSDIIPGYGDDCADEVDRQ